MKECNYWFRLRLSKLFPRPADATDFNELLGHPCTQCEACREAERAMLDQGPEDPARDIDSE